MERGVKTTLDRWLDKNGLPMRPPQAGGGDVPTGASYGKVKKGKKMGTDEGVCPYLLIRGNGEYVITKYVYMAFCLKALFA